MRAFFIHMSFWQLFGSFSLVTFRFGIFGAKILHKKCASKMLMTLTKALQNWKISVKALPKRLWKLTTKTKQLLQLKLLSFVMLMINN
jgi:hypothetical protein